MLGKVVLEEAYERAGKEEKSKAEAALYIAPEDRVRYMRQIHDVNDERVRLSNAHGIGYTVISLTVPGIQGISDKALAEKTAFETNNWAAEQIKHHRDRMGAFACLSMHDPKQAGQELRRCVQELGFHGALLCDFQHSGPKGETYLYYDQPAYDEFWKVLTELDVPLYIHPAAPCDVVLEKLYAQRQNLIGPPLSFANGVSLHTLGLISNGVFDRFPTAKVIIGHQGEHIPFDFWRINHWFEDVKRPIANEEGRVMAKKTIYDYFKQNIWITTSGHFSTSTLKYVVNEIGADRVLFSVDYPYETIENGCGWWDNDAEAIQEAVGGVDAYRRIGRDNAKKLLKLGSFHDSEAPVN
ncbi:amidohydrolase 2 [Penicillium macrosclerotiorum]|uniref:amidohydrolase 2 n=1 Tax=Penicillium macrosclerotiorum TaxID=303699 RepID=UPI0025488260|nr:amidohydrolase 2 [Penicillium macrosclerotiorum]KAJ5682567.1 amidohydrolase 2 [Penicillium macrosclerotiorum]